MQRVEKGVDADALLFLYPFFRCQRIRELNGSHRLAQQMSSEYSNLAASFTALQQENEQLKSQLSNLQGSSASAASATDHGRLNGESTTASNVVSTPLQRK